MSCNKCDDGQTINFDNDMPQICTFIRVGNGNVMISGCNEHLKQLIDIYRKGFDAIKDSE